MVKKAQLFRIALSQGAFDYKLSQLIRKSREEMIGQSGSSQMVNVILPTELAPNEYLTVDSVNTNWNSNNDSMASAEFASESVRALYGNTGHVQWRFVPNHMAVDTGARRLTTDRQCWHSHLTLNSTLVYPYQTQAAWFCQLIHPVFAPIGSSCRNQLSPIASTTSLQLEKSSRWGMMLWIRAALEDTAVHSNSAENRMRIVAGDPKTTVFSRVPSLAFDSKTQRLRFLFWRENQFALEGFEVVQQMLAVTISTQRWSHIAIEVIKNDEVRVYLDGTEVNTYRQTSASLISAGVWITRTEGTFKGMVVEAAIFKDGENHSTAMRDRLAQILRIHSDPCLMGLLTTKGVSDTPPGGIVINPGLDVFERVTSKSPKKYLADTTNPAESSFEYVRGDCSPDNELIAGGHYMFDAVYEQKITSTMGLFMEIAESRYIPKWLSACRLTNRTDSFTRFEFCLEANQTAVKWKVVETTQNGSAIIHPVGIPGAQVRVEITPDYSLTYPSIYNVHVTPKENSLLEMYTQKDVDIKLAADVTVDLFGAHSISCQGLCPLGNNIIDGAGFTLVRRFSNESVGVLWDRGHPLGKVEITPARYTNGTETYVWETRECASYCNATHTAGRFVSLYTGQCVYYSNDTSKEPYLFGRCDEFSPALSCWFMNTANRPHEESNSGKAVGISNTRTLMFDDTKLWWQPQIMAPSRSDSAHFLTRDSMTDVLFTLKVDPVPAYDVENINMMPLRMYTLDERPVAFRQCMAIEIDTGLKLSCSSECFTTQNTDTGLICNITVREKTTLGACQPDSCRPQVVSWDDPAIARQIDLELHKGTLGSTLKTRPWTSMDLVRDRRCISSNLEFKYKTMPFSGALGSLSNLDVQVSSCSNVDIVDYYQLMDPPDSYDLTSKLRGKLIRNMGQNMCLGLADDNQHVAMRSCTSTPSEKLLYARHSMADDGTVAGRPTSMPVAEDTEAIVSYRSSTASVTVLFYRKLSIGSVRAIVRLDSAQDDAELVHGSKIEETAAVSLVDSTARTRRAPSSHDYLVRVQRQTLNSTSELVKYILTSNGTVVDSYERVATLLPENEHATPVTRSHISKDIARPLSGVVSNVESRSIKIGVEHVQALDNARSRFGSGARFRIRRADNTIVYQNLTASACSERCRKVDAANKGDCVAARWNSYDKVCEMLSKCDKLLTVGEGNPASFNLRETPSYIYKNADHELYTTGSGGTRRLYPMSQDIQQMGGAMRAEQLKLATNTTEPRAVQFWDVRNIDVYPNASQIVSTSQALKTVTGLSSGQTQGQVLNRRLLSYESDESELEPWHNMTFIEYIDWWSKNWYTRVPTLKVREEYTKFTPPTSAPTFLPVVNETEYSMSKRFPVLLGRSRESGVDIQCTNAHTFVFVGQFRSTEARYGYRRVFSRASENTKTGGMQLLLSPDGHLKDRFSNVSIQTTGVSGCESIVVVDCFDEYRVSVDGRIEHYNKMCPFQLEHADTRVHSWAGRTDVMCFGGNRLYGNRHFELIAYLQSLYDKKPHNLCWKPKNGLSEIQSTAVDARFLALPVNAIDTRVEPARMKWKMSHLARVGDGHGSETKMRCMDPVVCDDPRTAQQFFKRQVVDYKANPFYFMSKEGHFAKLKPSPMTPLTKRIMEIEWVHGESGATQFSSNVTLSQEEAQCKVHKGLHEEGWTAPQCNCADSKFTAWQLVPERSQVCGECVTEEETRTHPQWRKGMVFLRRTGEMKPNTPTVRRHYRRTLNSTDGGCPELYSNPDSVLTKTVTEQCTPCPVDCKLEANSVFVMPASRQPAVAAACPSDRSQNLKCGTPAMRRSCSFGVRMLRQPKNNGITCTQAAVSDFRQIAQVHALQTTGTEELKHNQTGYPVAYKTSGISQLANFSYIEGDVVVTQTIFQTALYESQPWYWVSEDLSATTLAEATDVCPNVCKAENCVDFELDDSMDSGFVKFMKRAWSPLMGLLLIVAIFVCIHYTMLSKSSKLAEI